jgi:hypothetical protein
VSRRSRFGLAGLVVAVAVAVGLLLMLPRSASALDDAIAELRKNGQFTTSPRAGAALARISENLLRDGRACTRTARADPVKRTRCERRLAIAGWSSAAAVATLSCTQPGTQQIRRSLLDHLLAVRRAERARSTARPELPRLPTC